MSRTYYSLITRHGEQVIAKAIANNTPVPLKTMAVGDGNGTPTTPQANQTALVRETAQLTPHANARHPVKLELANAPHGCPSAYTTGIVFKR